MHIMVDIETLGVTPDSVITEIGAVTFSIRERLFRVRSEFSIRIDALAQMSEGRKIDLDTRDWWLRTDVKKFGRFFSSPGFNLRHALSMFRAWAAENPDPEGVWACGTDFDFPILSNAYGGNPPWAYSRVRDYRTLRQLFCCVPKPVNQDEHDALSDARNQAEHLHAILEHIKEIQK